MPDMTTGQRGSTATEPAFRSRVSSGLLIGGISPLVVADRLRTLHALIDDIGGGCWAYEPTAAALHGFDGWPLQPPYHLVVERGRNIARVGHVVHTSSSLPLLDRSSVEGIAVTSPTRTIIDLAADHDTTTLTTAIDSALRDRSTSEDFLFRELVRKRSRGRKGINRLLAVMAGADAAKGGQSWLEREFLRLGREAGLPAPVTQQVVGSRRQHLIRVDCRYPGTPVVVELLGYRFHRSVMQMQVDAERMNAMVLGGLVPLQFTYTDVVDDADRTIGTGRAALASRSIS